MKKIALILLVISANWLFGADNSDIIWTWGNGKSIASILSFLYFLLNIDTLAVIIKYAGLIGMGIVFFREYAKGVGFQPGAAALKMLFFIIVSEVTIYGFLIVERDSAHRVYILSANELSAASWQKCRPVNGDNECYAPLGIKMLMTYATNFERAGIGMMESSMMDANAMSYSFSRMGLGFGFTFYDHISKTKGDPYTYNTFMEFYENCIIYDFTDGSKTVEGLYKSNDLASYILSSNSRLTNVYSASNPNGIIKTCYEVSSAHLWGNIHCGNTAKQLQAKASGSAASETTVDDICQAAENFGQHMFNSTKDASAQIEQRTIMNLTNEAIINGAIASGIDPTTLAYGTAMADREQRSKWMVMGVMAKEWIPSMRGIMQGIALGLIWVLAILSIMTASPAPYLGSVVGFQVTLIIWSFILALINFMTIDRMADSLPNIFLGELGAGDQMTLWSQPTFDEENQKAMAFLGYMSVLSYGIASKLVTFGGNRLASLGDAVGQLSVGMGTSANMAKSHFDHGIDKSDSSGAQHFNRDGSIDRINPSGFAEHQTNQAGHSTYKESVSSQYGGSNDIEKTTNADGSSAFKASYGSESVTMNGKDGKVTNANLGSSIQSAIDQSHSHEIEKTKGQAAALEKSGSNRLSSSIQDTNTTAQQVTKGVGKEQGTAAGSEFAHKYNENVQHNLSEAFKEVNGSQETLQKLRGIDMSAGVQVEASAAGGFTVFGNGVQTKGSVNAGVKGSSSAQSGDRVSVDLTKEEAQAFSKSMATGLDVTAKSSDSISANQRENISHNTENALTKTNQASHDFAQSAKLTETASKMEKDKDGIATSLKKDLNVEVAQRIIDSRGFQQGTDALLHDKSLVESTAQKIIQEKNNAMPKVDTDSTFKKAESEISHTQGSVNPVNTFNPQNVDLNGKYTGYQGEVTHQGTQWQNNMPSTDNAPTYQDDHTRTKVEESKAKHVARGDSLVMNAIPDVVRDVPNVKFSADGTYTDLDGKKHDWANKGRTEH